MALNDHKHGNVLGHSIHEYIPQLSVDCVVFGFHENQLRVLLMKSLRKDSWAMPGGYIFMDETAEQAAARVLYERTGLKGVFLQQFRFFSEPDRNRMRFDPEFLQKTGWSEEEIKWLNRRFLTVGFYALVNYTKVIPSPDVFSEMTDWWDIGEPVQLIMDHGAILEAALEALRLQLNYQPIGINLLPQKFTMPELQRLYETILGKKLDRRNFQRKIHSYGILSNLNERKASGGAHKAPYLYSFNREKYEQALKDGLKGGW